MSRMYLAFTATAFQARLAYRGEVWASLFGRLVEVLARIAIWTAVFAGTSRVDGVSLADMITYSLIAGTVLGAWDPAYLISEVGKAVRSGDVAIHLLKPFHYPLYLFAVEIGNLGFLLITSVMPIIVIIGLIYGFQMPESAAYGALFLAFWLLSFCIFFLLATAIGLLSFWIMDANALDWFLKGIMSFLSGSIVPLWFFPAALAGIAHILPFGWISYYPAAVYLGKLNMFDAGLALTGGIAWALVLAGAVSLLWSRARHRIVVQGG